MKKYCVYEHVFPNGKKYIGISCDAEKRWRNGKGYEKQGKIANAIKHYGWENVKHNIILDSVSKEQAEALEEYLIANCHTIDDGYNTTIGGNTVGGYYLDGYILGMIRYAQRYFPQNYVYPVVFDKGESIGMPELVEEGKTNKDIADFYNEASKAVTTKHRKYSTTDESDVLAYFFHMREYYLLSIAINTNKDVSDWKEEICTVERYERM